MKWLKKILGIKSPEEKLRSKILEYEQKSFDAQRKGDMEEAGKWKVKAEEASERLYNDDITISKEK